MARGNGVAYRLCLQSFNLANFCKAIYSFKILVSVYINTDMFTPCMAQFLAIYNRKNSFLPKTYIELFKYLLCHFYFMKQYT